MEYALFQNIQATSQKALRNGDGTTIADLTSSHQLSLQMMQNHTREMWNCAAQLREIRQTLTKQVHTKLQSIAQMQMRLSTNNGCLVFWHECMKLAKRRWVYLALFNMIVSHSCTCMHMCMYVPTSGMVYMFVHVEEKESPTAYSNACNLSHFEKWFCICTDELFIQSLLVKEN